MRDYEIFLAIENELRKQGQWKNLKQNEFIHLLFQDKYPNLTSKKLANVYSSWKQGCTQTIGNDIPPPFVKTTFNNFLIPPHYATFCSTSLFGWVVLLTPLK